MDGLLGWLGWGVAGLGFLWVIFGDRFKVESRMTSIEVKVDVLTAAVALIADQRTKITAVETLLAGVGDRLNRYEVRLNQLEGTHERT